MSRLITVETAEIRELADKVAKLAHEITHPVTDADKAMAERARLDREIDGAGGFGDFR